MKAIITDLDRTLLWTDKTISEHEVLAAADYVTAANDLDGVAQWIEKHLL